MILTESLSVPSKMPGEVDLSTSRLPIVIYDGQCGVCNRAVRFIIKIDRKERLMFCSSDARQAQVIAGRFFGQTGATVLLVEGGKISTRSDAFIRILEIVGGAWSFARLFRIIPSALRNMIYDFIARNRHRFGAKTNRCEFPETTYGHRFIK